jgi:DNA-binding NtrC family response regulator
MSSTPRKLIVLDGDDDLALQAKRVFGGWLFVVPVRNPRRAIGMLEVDPSVQAIITEQVMRGANGVDLLDSIRTMRPGVRRVMLTSYSDLASIVGGLHSGAIQCLIQKPVTDAELLTAVCPQAARQSLQLKLASAS